MNHTPGPWVVGSEGLSGNPPYANIYHLDDAPIIASVLSEEVGEEAAKANAALIAAAPDLLEACKVLRTYLTDGPTANLCRQLTGKDDFDPDCRREVAESRLRNMLSAAIVKAEGRL